jgi:predicted ABC-class ATPase
MVSEDIQNAVEEGQAELAEMHDTGITTLTEHLSCAVGCETPQDFIANVNEVITHLDAMRRDLVQFRDAVKSYLPRATARKASLSNGEEVKR